MKKRILLIFMFASVSVFAQNTISVEKETKPLVEKISMDISVICTH